MSNEEKKVIDLLKNIDKQKCIMLECPVVKNNIERQLKIIELNRIIRKQSKEIEELKTEKAKRSWVHIKENGEVEPLFYVSKDKIKAKIEEIEKRRLQDGECELALHEFQREAKLEVLQSLLEEEE